MWISLQLLITFYSRRSGRGRYSKFCVVVLARVEVRQVGICDCEEHGVCVLGGILEEHKLSFNRNDFAVMSHVIEALDGVGLDAVVVLLPM